MSITIEYINECEDVYDITVEDNHNFYANDVLVHNCMEILITNKELKSIEDGYNRQLVDVLDVDLFNNKMNEHGFVPRKYEGIAFKVLNTDAEIETAKYPTFGYVEDEDAGEIALCILSALNVGEINSEEELQRACKMAVRGLDNLIDLQEYPLKAAELSAKTRRTLGIGVTNFAYYLAKKGVKYSDGSALRATHELFESIQYYLMRESVELAKERGACEKFNETRYYQGILPIDTYAKKLDSIVSPKLNHDWEELRRLIQIYGMRHSTLSAIMPVESSSLVSGCNAIENEIITDKGIMNFADIAKMTNLPDAESLSKIDKGWFEFNQPLQVKNMHGEYEQASKFFYNGMEPVTRITFEDGNTYEFTNEHKLMVNGKWTKVKDITTEMMVDNLENVDNGVIMTVEHNIKTVATYDIEVGGKEGTHSYMLSNGCVSHNSSNGIEPIKALTTTKAGKTLVAKDVEYLFGSYELMWDMPSNKGFLEVAAVIQKFVDQSISTNTRYDPNKFPDKKVPYRLILKDLIYGTSLGLKTFYYQITNDDKEKERKNSETELLSSGGVDNEDENCISCVL